MKEQINVGATTMVLLVKYYKPEMIMLLKKNGIIVPARASDTNIIDLIVATAKASKQFRKDLKDFISKPQVLSTLFNSFRNFTDDPKFYGFTEEAEYFKFVEEAQYFRMDGNYANAVGMNIPSFSTNPNFQSQFGLNFGTTSNNTSTTTNAPSAATPAASSNNQTGSFWSKAFDFVNKSVETFVTLDSNKTTRAIAEAQITTSNQKPKTEEENSTEKNKDKDGEQNSTSTYIWLGVLAAVVVGAVGYFVWKNKYKKPA